MLRNISKDSLIDQTFLPQQPKEHLNPNRTKIRAEKTYLSNTKSSNVRIAQTNRIELKHNLRQPQIKVKMVESKNSTPHLTKSDPDVVSL